MTLEGTGRALWHALAAPDDARRAGRRPALAAFGADPAQVAADIAPVLAELHAHRRDRGAGVTAAWRPALVVGAVAGYGLPGRGPAARTRRSTARRGGRCSTSRPASASPRSLAAAVADGALPVTGAPGARRPGRATSRRCGCACCSSGRCSTRPPGSSARGIRSRVLKGPAVAHLDYPDPALRAFGDVDLLVAVGGLRPGARAPARVRRATPLHRGAARLRPPLGQGRVPRRRRRHRRSTSTARSSPDRSG